MSDPASPGEASNEAPRSAASLVSPGFAGLLACAFCGLSSFYLLLSVLPLVASRHGTQAAGLVTGVALLACVVVELTVAARLARLGPRAWMALGAALFAAPDLLLLTGHGLPLLLGVSLVRGVGLAITGVAGTTIAAGLAPPGRRGETLGIYGVAVSLPAVVGLPVGVWLALQVGFTAVYLSALGFGILAMLLALVIPDRRLALTHAPTTFGVIRLAGARRPALVFVTATVATGIYATFLPVAMERGPGILVSVALLAQTATSSAVRWVAGRVGDRLGAVRLLLPALVVAILGAALVTAIGLAPLVIVGMLLFGSGFGALQNVTLSLMFEAAGERHFGGVSGVWNAAYDLGLGGGALAFGYLQVVTGYPIGFAATALVLCGGLLPALHVRAAHRTAPAGPST